MQIAPEQGAFLTILTRALGVRSAIEIGTFTGYSALCIARGLPADGRLLCCDVSEEWTAIGRTHWEQAGVADRIELRIAPAVDTLAALPAEPQFDLAFIDADKPNYANYFEALVARDAPERRRSSSTTCCGAATSSSRTPTTTTRRRSRRSTTRSQPTTASTP